LGGIANNIKTKDNEENLFNGGKNVDKETIAEILSDDEEREQRLHELLKARRSLNINTELSKTSTFANRMADRLAKFAGSWRFLIYFTVAVFGYATINTTIIMSKPFDPYPYIFLNLVLACVASLQAPVIMMSQNRESQKDRLRAENDYLINLKSEIILEDLHMKIDELLLDQKRLKKQMNDIMININSINEVSSLKDGSIRSEMDGKINTGGEKPAVQRRDHRTH
jgi:uncharacterized membrane protein